MQCVSTVSFKVVLNGESKCDIKPQKGIRQGDPISLFLFIIFADALSSMLNKGVEDRSFVGINVKRKSPTMCHLLFADDSLFFIKAKEEEVMALLRILQCYRATSGQCAN